MSTTDFHTRLPSFLHYSFLSPEDTPLLVVLVKKCYGDNYVHRYFYDAETLTTLIRNGSLFCAVATHNNDAGQRKVVAHMAVKVEYPGDHTADNFAGMMLPEYRGKGVLMQLGALLLPVYRQLDLYCLQTATVTHHALSQKISHNTGTITCGCLLADSPGSNADDLQFDHRMPILMQCYPLGQRPLCELYVPASLRPLLQRIYAALPFPVRFPAGIADEKTIHHTSTTEMQSNTRRGTALLRFHRIGKDNTGQLHAFSQHHAATAACYIDVPLADPAAPSLVMAAYATGFFFGGVIFGRNSTDLLRLQRCAIPPEKSRDGIIDDPVSREIVSAILDQATHGITATVSP